MTHGDAHLPTAAIRRAGELSVVAGALLIASDGMIVRVPLPGAVSAVFAALVSAIGLVAPFVILPTGIRVVAHHRPSPMPVTAARATVAGSTATLCCVVIGVGSVGGTSLSALLGGGWVLPDRWWISTGLAGCAGGVGAAAARSLARARVHWSPAFSTQAALRDSGRPDLLDDLATLLAHLLPGSAAARGGAWMNRRLDDWSWSPRRHRVGFVAASACVAGASLTLRRTSSPAGVWSATTWPGSLAAVAFALVVSGAIAAGLAAGIVWLGLLRRSLPN